mgnify:CR=1 FL=1
MSLTEIRRLELELELLQKEFERKTNLVAAYERVIIKDLDGDARVSFMHHFNRRWRDIDDEKRAKNK